MFMNHDLNPQHVFGNYAFKWLPYFPRVGQLLFENSAAIGYRAISNCCSNLNLRASSRLQSTVCWLNNIELNQFHDLPYRLEFQTYQDGIFLKPQVDSNIANTIYLYCSDPCAWTMVDNV